MGKFTAGLTRLTPTDPGKVAAAEAAALTDSIAAAGTPAAEVAEAARPVQVGGVAFDVEQAPLPEAPRLTGDQAQLQQLQEAGHTRVEEGPGGEQVARPATPEEVQEDYEEELSREAKAFNVYNPETGAVEIPTGGLAQGNVGVDKVVDDMAKLSSALSPRKKQTVGPRNARVKIPASGATTGLPDALVEPMQKLGVAKQVGTNMVLDEGAGNVAYLALLGSLKDLASGTGVATKSDLDIARAPQGVDQEAAIASLKPQDLKRYEEDLQIPRWQFHEEIGRKFVEMVAPSANIDPQTGARVGEDTGYVPPPGKELSGQQMAQIGHYILAGAEFSGMGTGVKLPEGDNPIFVRRLKPGSTSGNTSYEYKLTPAGAKYLDELSPVLDQVFPGKSRPVSLVPSPGGKPVSRAALRHKARTRVPDESASEISDTMQAALDVLGRTPNMVNNEKLSFMQTALMDTMQKSQQLDRMAAQQLEQMGDVPNRREALEQIKDRLVAADPNLESGFASMFNQDRKSFNKRAKTAGMRYGRDSGIMDYKFASQVREAALAQSMKTLGNPMDPQTTPGEATSYKNKVFYYQGTVVGNSGRIMVSNTELNYQNNKLSRFLVDNPKPVMVTKGGKNDRNFRYVVARNVVDGADLYTPEQLLKEFDKIESTIRPVAQQLAAAVKSNDPAALNAALAAVKQVKGIPQDWKMKDEWGFVVDGLVEYGKYASLPDGAQMGTRLKAEGDGINNGSSIQGMQFGIDTIVRRAGVIYDGEGNVIPEGNMRKALFESMEKSMDRMNLKNDIDDAETLSNFFNIINQSEDRSSLVKSLVKLPLMTTVYGMPANAHGDHVREWFADNDDLFAGMADDDYQNLVNLVNLSLENSLGDTLGQAIFHQKLVKQSAGYLFNAMEEIAHVRGANGYFWQAGGYDQVVDELEFKAFPTSPEGERLKGPEAGLAKEPVSKFEAREKVPSALGARFGESKTKYVRDEAGEIVTDEAGKKLVEVVPGKKQVGKALRNQIAVNGTHNIDATIAQNTMIEADLQGLWGHQVFDAFMGDVETFGPILEIANKEFVNVNANYDIIQAEKEAFERAFDNYKKKIKDSPSNTFEITPKSGIGFFLETQTRSKSNWTFDKTEDLRASLKKFGIEFKKIETPWASGEGVSVKYVPDFDKIKPLNKAQMINLMKFFIDHYGVADHENPKGKARPILQAFDKANSDAKRDKAKVLAQLKQQKGKVRQYN